MSVAGAVWNSGVSPELLEKLGNRPGNDYRIGNGPFRGQTDPNKFAPNPLLRKDNKEFALYWERIAYPLYSEEQAHGVTFKPKRNSPPRYCPSRIA